MSVFGQVFHSKASVITDVFVRIHSDSKDNLKYNNDDTVDDYRKTLDHLFNITIKYFITGLHFLKSKLLCCEI